MMQVLSQQRMSRTIILKKCIEYVIDLCKSTVNITKSYILWYICYTLHMEGAKKKTINSKFSNYPLIVFILGGDE